MFQYIFHQLIDLEVFFSSLMNYLPKLKAFDKYKVFQN